MKNKAFLGIDVSKGYADFLLLDQDKQILEDPFQLNDNKAGRLKLSHIIDHWFSLGLKELFCGVESTGGYENNWFSHLQNLAVEQNIKVARLNPKGVKSVSEAALKRTITDAVSAENIAVYLIAFPEKIIYRDKPVEFDNTFKEARQTLTFRHMLTKQRVQLNNQLEKLLYQYFSETLVYCRNGMPNWLLEMLVKYPSAKQVSRASEKMLVRIKGISMNKAQAILRKVQPSTQSVSEQIKHLISETAREILHKKELIENEDRIITRRYEQHDQVKLLSTIKGIGPSTAIRILLEIEDIKRFESAKQLCSFFGVHPTFKQSGDGTWGSRMSKKGRPDIRAALYMSCLSAIRTDENTKQLYARFRTKGMNHYQAMGVVMHKRLRIIYGVLKKQTHYDPRIDLQNIESANQKKEEAEAKIQELNLHKRRRAERYSEGGIDAPISRIAAQKRKKQEASQSLLTKENTGLPPA
ncbi:IS110 family transposase [Salegentibacter agarivorans]